MATHDSWTSSRFSNPIDVDTGAWRGTEGFFASADTGARAALAASLPRLAASLPVCAPLPPQSITVPSACPDRLFQQV